VCLISAAVTACPADVGVLCDNPALLGDTIKGTPRKTDHGYEYQYYDLVGSDVPSYIIVTPHRTATFKYTALSLRIVFVSKGNGKYFGRFNWEDVGKANYLYSGN
jgi:hypothetical protein